MYKYTHMISLIIPMKNESEGLTILFSKLMPNLQSVNKPLKLLPSTMAAMMILWCVY